MKGLHELEVSEYEQLLKEFMVAIDNFHLGRFTQADFDVSAKTCIMSAITIQDLNRKFTPALWQRKQQARSILTWVDVLKIEYHEIDFYGTWFSYSGILAFLKLN